jgi:sporulation protein YlmC with PRC-barrel domain
MFTDIYDRALYGDRGFGDQRRDRRWDEDRSFAGHPSRDERYHYGTPDNQRFDNRDEERRVPRDETSRLIASNKVDGTRVYDPDGRRLGRIENFMVSKRAGRVEYAVLSFGGFMGVGERHFPVPWDELTYDERLGGYVIAITERDLERAPSYDAARSPRFDDRYRDDIDSYYGVGAYYW